MELLEREREQAVLEAALEESRTAGRVVVVLGEAGIGKTALVTAASQAADRRVLWGGCDPLVTPRALGPLRDVARDAGGALAAAVQAGGREEVLGATLDALEEDASILVVEDVHWADDATLDLVALLGRRLARSRGCLVLTCRSDALRERPEVRRVLTALPRESVRRIEPRALSPDAVAALAERAGREAADLHALSGGNPFFVTEALAAPGDTRVPASVRDAIDQRLAGIDAPARAVVELAAVIPGQPELWLIEETIHADAATIDQCIAAGLLNLRGDALVFRHDLARRAVEDGIAPVRRRELDRTVLAALEVAGGADPARLAHHARRAGDTDAIRRLAPPAARAAAAAGGHRQALEQWEAALAAGDEDALEGVAVEAYLCGHTERAVQARRVLLERHESQGDALRAGDDLRWLSRLLWWAGQGPEAAEVGDRSIAVLEAFPDSHELAMALSGQSQLAMLAERNEEAIALGTRAVELARRLDDSETVAHALTNVGTALMKDADRERGRALLEEAFVLAAGTGHDDHAARALVNLATGTLVRYRDDQRVVDDIARALAYARERELDGYVQYLLGVRANLQLLVGRWAQAEADAHASLDFGEQRGVSLCPAYIALGRLRARRGNPEAGATLEHAWTLAVSTGELQRLAPAAAARAEHAWFDGDLAGTITAARSAYALAAARDDPWAHGELAWWLWRAGAPVPPRDDDPEPYARAIAGDWRGAAAAWARLGFPYERAQALADADDDAARLEALSVLDAHGATRAASHLRRRLRAAGMRRIPRGPRAASRAGPAGLTPRETQVLELIVDGATNAQIARALVITPKTVDHHVSAVLGKLGVASRRDAAAALARLEERRG